MVLNYTPRKEQIIIRDFVRDSITIDKKKFMMIEAPTGVGKSYAALMICDWYKKNVNEEAKFDILTNSKLLQDQYTKDFKFIADLKGKDNYNCGPTMTCAEGHWHNMVKKSFCHDCPHTAAKKDYIKSDISLTNFHLFFNYVLYADKFLDSRKSKVLIVDESHSFEEVYCEFVSCNVTKNFLEKLDIWKPEMATQLNSISNILQLSNFVRNHVVNKLEAKMETIKSSLSKKRTDKNKLKNLKKMDYLDKAKCKYYRFLNDETNYEDNWVYESWLDDNNIKGFSIQPVWANKYLRRDIWWRYDHVIFMSGTILNHKLFGAVLGLYPNEIAHLEVDCPFEAKNRPIYYIKMGKMSFNEKVKTFDSIKKAIPKILKKHKGEKGIIHTANYEIAKWIQKSEKSDRLLYHDGATTRDCLAIHSSSTKDTVIVSPSMMAGVDLKDDLSRFQVIIKVPFPNLGSKKIQKRMADFPSWFYWKTMSDLIQSYGRSIRNDKDWAKTYILDSCFDSVVTKPLLPKYVQDALHVIKT